MKKKILEFLVATCIVLLYSMDGYAQKVGVKTNLLYDATTTANLGLEIGLARQWTLDVSGNYNGWTSSETRKFKHWLIQPEARYWFCQKFNGHFLGLHGHYSKFNMGGFKLPFGLYKGLRDNRYQGDLYGAGLSYGYHWILGKRWGFEATIGAGYARINYDRIQCKTCGDKTGPHHKNYWGPTKAGISLIYLIK